MTVVLENTMNAIRQRLRFLQGPRGAQGAPGQQGEAGEMVSTALGTSFCSPTERVTRNLMVVFGI